MTDLMSEETEAKAGVGRNYRGGEEGGVGWRRRGSEEGGVVRSARSSDVLGLEGDLGLCFLLDRAEVQLDGGGGPGEGRQEQQQSEGGEEGVGGHSTLSKPNKSTKSR